VGREARLTLERVLELYRERYYDLNVQHFHAHGRSTPPLATLPSPMSHHLEWWSGSNTT
jgi:hypothetical protein